MKERGNLKSTNKSAVFETRTMVSRVSYIAVRGGYHFVDDVHDIIPYITILKFSLSPNIL